MNSERQEIIGDLELWRRVALYSSQWWAEKQHAIGVGNDGWTVADHNRVMALRRSFFLGDIIAHLSQDAAQQVTGTECAKCWESLKGFGVVEHIRSV